MIELLIRLLPLIFFSCAIGILVINIRPIFMYFIYVISMAVQPKQLLRTSQQLEVQKTQTNGIKFTPLTPILRLWTVIRVLFFPDLDMSGIIHKNTSNDTDWTNSIYQQKTQEQFAQVQIKTYSVAGQKDTSHFTSALELAEVGSISPEFSKTFPDLSKNLISKKQYDKTPLGSTHFQ